MREIENMREEAVASRVSESDKKGWDKFTKSLDRNLTKLRLEVEDEVIEGSTQGSTVRGNKGIDGFFSSLMRVPKIAQNTGSPSQEK